MFLPVAMFDTLMMASLSQNTPIAMHSSNIQDVRLVIVQVLLADDFPSENF